MTNIQNIIRSHHLRIHAMECAKQTVFITAPAEIAAGSTAIFLGLVNPPGFVAFGGAVLLGSSLFFVSCLWGNIADEVSASVAISPGSSVLNTGAVTLARCVGGVVKTTIAPDTKISGFNNKIIGCFNHGAYGLASKTLSEPVTSSIVIETTEGVLKGMLTAAKYGNVVVGSVSGIVVGVCSWLYTPTEDAVVLDLALHKWQCHSNCHVARRVTYNNITTCPSDIEMGSMIDTKVMPVGEDGNTEL